MYLKIKVAVVFAQNVIYTLTFHQNKLLATRYSITDTYRGKMKNSFMNGSCLIVRRVNEDYRSR